MKHLFSFMMMLAFFVNGCVDPVITNTPTVEEWIVIHSIQTQNSGVVPIPATPGGSWNAATALPTSTFAPGDPNQKYYDPSWYNDCSENAGIGCNEMRTAEANLTQWALTPIP